MKALIKILLSIHLEGVPPQYKGRYSGVWAGPY